MSSKIVPKKDTTIDIFMFILQAKKEFPGLRVGQLISNATRRAGFENCDPYYIDDEALLKALKEESES